MKKFYAFLLAAAVAIAAVPAAAQAFPGKKAPAKAQTENMLSNVLEKTPVVKTFAAAPALKNQVEVKSTVAVTNGPRKVTPLITEAPEGTLKFYNRSGMAYYRSSGSIASDEQEGILNVVFADNNEVYLLNPICYCSTDSWVKGTIEGNTITVELPQTLYLTNNGYNLELAWVNIVEGSTSDTADRETTSATFTIDGNTITLNGSSETHVLGGVWDDDDTWYGAGDWNSVYTETELEDVITPPAGIAPVTYYYSGTSYYSSTNHSFNSTVQIVKDGNDIYFQGLATGDASYEILPEAWAKGTLEDGKVTIPMGQYMGLYSGSLIYLVGYVNNGAGDITFTYDAEADTYTLDNEMFINGKSDDIYYYTYTKSGAVISQETPEVPELVVVPETATIEDDWSIQASGSKEIAMATEVAFDGNDVYFKGVAYWFPEGWIKGTIEDGVAYFPSGQLIGEDSYGPEYISSLDGEPIEFTYDAVNHVFTMTSDYLLETSDPAYNGSNYYVYFSSMKIFKGEIVEPEPIEVPEGLVAETYTWTGYDVSFEDTDDDEATEDEAVYTEFTRFVNIGFDGNDVYVQGVCTEFPEAWIKGTLEGNTVTFPTGQFFDKDDSWVSWGYPADYYYFVGYGANGIQDVTFTYDAENNHFVSEDWIIINGKEDVLYYYSINAENEWNKFVEVAGKPADPEITDAQLENVTFPKVRINIPLETTTGDAMNPAKVAYRIFTDVEHVIEPLPFEPEDYPRLGIEETMYEIPYNMHDDYDIYTGGSLVYLNQDPDFLALINKIGVQVVYYGGMDTGTGAPRREAADNETEIIWYDVKDYLDTAIEDLTGAKAVESVTYVNAAGLTSDKPFDGINMVVKKLSDGSTVVTKVLK
ncbi:MAG: hypothetical protein IKR25_01605 [Muribaculaceae bacterium]|nr:hypothetical protein [Muribaculaceae bacterium]